MDSKIAYWVLVYASIAGIMVGCFCIGWIMAKHYNPPKTVVKVCAIIPDDSDKPLPPGVYPCY